MLIESLIKIGIDTVPKLEITINRIPSQSLVLYFRKYFLSVERFFIFKIKKD
jgi:hypothetical protein